MKGFSFFTRVLGGPGTIRAKQMAEALGGRVNPVDHFENDICIYVLGTTPKDHEPPRAYYDVLDCSRARVSRVRAKKGPILAASLTHQEVLRQGMPNREIIYLPQHHCNFESISRPDRVIKNVGCIGGWSAVQCSHYELALGLDETGLRWLFESHYHSRAAVVEFYKTLDIQICYRPHHARELQTSMNCLKLANAGSFGIPTVAFPEPAYVAEWKDACLWGETLQEIVQQTKRLQQELGLYEEMSGRAKERANFYNMDRTCERYRSLL